MKKYLSFVGIVFFIIVFSINSFGAENYEKKDVAVFSVYSEVMNIPSQVESGINQAVQSAFNEMKRFNVLFYPGMKLDVKYLEEFIEYIKQRKLEDVKGDDDPEFGNIVFDVNKIDDIASSFYIVIPNLSYFNEEYIENYDEEDDEYTYEYKVYANISLKIVNVETYEVIGDIYKEYEYTSDESFLEAEQDTISGIKYGIAYEIKNIEEFQLKTGVIKREGLTVYLDIGSEVGVKVGHEFHVVGKEKIGDKFREEKVGLVRVKEVSRDLAIAIILIEEKKITEGDQLKEYNRTGLNVTVGIIGSLNSEPKSEGDGLITFNFPSLLIGGEIINKTYIGYSSFLELGVGGYLTTPLSYTASIGYGYSIFFRRISLSASISGIYFGLYHDNIVTGFTFGGRAKIEISYLLNYSSAFCISGGYQLIAPMTSYVYEDEKQPETTIDMNPALNLSGLFINVSYILRL